MPAASATRPISPSSASTSRTRWPLPRPPIAGLQDMAPMVTKRWVTSAVLAPMRAEAAAASQPAWPPPTTSTSNFASIGRHLRPPPCSETRSLFHVKHRDGASLADAEVAEDHTHNVLDPNAPGQPLQRP